MPGNDDANVLDLKKSAFKGSKLFWRIHFLKGRVVARKWMNFRNSSKGGGGVIFNPKIYIADFRPLNEALKLIFPKWGGGGHRPFGFFWKFIRFGTLTRPLDTTDPFKRFWIWQNI